MQENNFKLTIHLLVLFADNIVAIECPFLLFVKPKKHEKGKQSKKRGRVLEEENR